MSSSGYQRFCLRNFGFSFTAVLCFLIIFFVYYNRDIKSSFLYLSIMEKDNDSVIVCATEAQTKFSTQNCSMKHQTNPPLNHTQRIQAAPLDIRQTVLIMWMWPFDHKYNLSCDVFNITGCHVTTNRSLYHKAHGVIFHHRDIQGNLGRLPQEPRPSFQKWVWFNMESPANSARVPGLNNLFNLTCNYRLDSSIPVPYGHLEPLPSEDQPFKLPTKDKLVCWVVSSWNSDYKRVKYYYKLKKYITINIYGSAFGKRVSDEDYTKIVSSCKFYLSFENSVYKDYITEKLFRPMELGTVPVVLGPSRQNYEEHVPPHSFIHVDDLPTPEELAERLLYLDKNDTEYMRYFDWKKKFQVKLFMFVREHACKTCSYLQRNRGYRVFHDLNKWYWG